MNNNIAGPICQTFVPKSWGFEKWHVNNTKYCGKTLFFVKGKACSWHYHCLKMETFYVHSGELKVYYGDNDNFSEAHTIILKAGDNFHVPTGLRHRMEGLTDVEMFEFSTHHEDSDSYRLPIGAD